jgi:co-chaperonin GroES (HSP10)
MITTRNNLLVKQIPEKNIDGHVSISSRLNYDNDIGIVIATSDNTKNFIGKTVVFGKMSGVYVGIDKEKYLLLTDKEVLFGIKATDIDIKVINSSEMYYLEKFSDIEIKKIIDAKNEIKIKI